MTTLEASYNAALVFADEAEISVEQFIAPLRMAFHSYDMPRVMVQNTGFEAVSLVGDAVAVHLRIEDAPEGGPDGATLAEDLPATPTFRLRITLSRHANLPYANPRAAEVMLAEVLSTFIEMTGAPYVIWLDAEAHIPSREFQKAVSPIAFGRDDSADQAEPAGEDAPADLPVCAATPRRIRPTTKHRAARCGGLTDAEAFDRAAEAAKASGRLMTLPAPEVSDLETLEEVFRCDVDLPEEWVAEQNDRRPERRIATWTVTASVAVFSPPVAAAMTTYNLMRGENFRLTAQVLTLTGAFMGLGLTRAVAETIQALPF